MWVRHVEAAHRGVTSDEGFCQAVCHFGVCPLTAVFWDS